MDGEPTKHFCPKCWSVSCEHCQAVVKVEDWRCSDADCPSSCVHGGKPEERA